MIEKVNKTDKSAASLVKNRRKVTNYQYRKQKGAVTIAPTDIKIF